MIREVLNENMTRAEARRALLQAGWSFIGGGSFAAVYGSPDGTRVAKVTKPDRGAEATMELSIAEKGGEGPGRNPYLPRYYDALPMRNGGFVYEVERLLPFEGWADLEEAESRAMESELGAATLEKLEELGANDSHWRNAMQRGDGTIVFTDYIADLSGLRNASVNAADAEFGAFENPSRGGSNHWADAA